MTPTTFRRAGAGVLLVVTIASGCTGHAPAEQGPSPTEWGPQLSEEEAFARIPLDGTEVSPISWEAPEVDDPETAAALLAARRFRVLDHHTSSQPTEADTYLYQWVATGRMIEVDYPDGPPGPEGSGFPPSRGPVWLWVVEVEGTSAGQVVVHMCEDHGWRGSANGSEELPSVNRAFLWHFEVVKRRSDGGNQRWLVDRVWADRDLLGPDVRRECEEWAVHDPEEDG